MKPRPKVGDRIEFRRGREAMRTGTVTAVDVVGVHYVIESKGKTYLIGLSAVVKILPCDTGTPEAMSR